MRSIQDIFQNGRPLLTTLAVFLTVLLAAEPSHAQFNAANDNQRRAANDNYKRQQQQDQAARQRREQEQAQQRQQQLLQTQRQQEAERARNQAAQARTRQQQIFQNQQIANKAQQAGRTQQQQQQLREQKRLAFQKDLADRRQRMVQGQRATTVAATAQARQRQIKETTRPPTPGEIQKGFTGRTTGDGRALVKFKNRILVVPASRISGLSARLAKERQDQTARAVSAQQNPLVASRLQSLAVPKASNSNFKDRSIAAAAARGGQGRDDDDKPPNGPALAIAPLDKRPLRGANDGGVHAGPSIAAVPDRPRPAPGGADPETNKKLVADFLADHGRKPQEMSGWDLSHPIERKVVMPGERIEVCQYQAIGSAKGSYFGPCGQRPAQSGINAAGSLPRPSSATSGPGATGGTEVIMWKQVSRSTLPVGSEYLVGVASGTHDTWSTSRKEWVPGGGLQYLVPSRRPEPANSNASP